MQVKNEEKLKSQVRVSVCVIAYNQVHYIRECLESLVSQVTDFQFEIVVRDDASNDGTADVVLELQNKYPSLIKMLDGFKNLGMNKNILEVFQAASGDYLALCEGDDYWIDNGKLQKQFSALEAHPDIDLCCHPALVRVGKHVKQHKKIGNYAKEIVVISASEIIKNDGGFIATPSIMIRKPVISRLPEWFSEAPIGDYFIQVCGALRGGCLFLPQAMAVYRRNSTTSWSVDMSNHKQKRIFLEKYINYLHLFSETLVNTYQAEFNMTKSRAFCSLALSSIMVNINPDFKNYIQLSWNLSQGFSRYQKIIYYLRFSPLMLKYLYRVAKKYLS